jgi:hypothetical protein
MGRLTAPRLATLFVVLTLLVALAFSLDPIFGRPNTCLPSSNLLVLIAGCP